MTGSAFHIDRTYKEIKRSSEGEPHIRSGGSDFGLDIGKTPRGEKDADAFADLVAIEWLASFLREHLQQVVAIRDTRQVDGCDGASGISRHYRKG
jgi:hypothetical protein